MLNTNTMEKFIKTLKLEPHPEGGFYKENYRSKDIIEPKTRQYAEKEKEASTSIYFLLAKGNFSAWHKLKSDELWHFYYGSPLIIYTIDENGKLDEKFVGNPIDNEKNQFQVVINANTWFAAEVSEQSENAYSLVGCTVSPAFDFLDFELANRKALAYKYPKHEQIINKLTRSENNTIKPPVDNNSTIEEKASNSITNARFS